MEGAGVRVLERLRVAPAPPCPSAELSITFFDAAWFFTGPVERLFFYRHDHPAAALPLLAASLPHALARFFPLAGTLSPATRRLSYSSAHDALHLQLAECQDDNFDRLVAAGPRDLSLMRPLVPALPPPGKDGAFALAAVQATVFPGRGVCVGVSVHHAACDDASATLFVRTWAAACRLGGPLDGADHSQAVPRPPVLDRSLVADPDDLLGKTLAGMSRLASGPPPPPPPAQGPPPPSPVIASFPLTRDQIEDIKDAAVAAPGTWRLSSFVAASALAWVCLLRCRSAGVQGAARSHMLFSAECRSRLSPPLPAEYFGNCLRPCFVEAATEDLLKSDDAGGGRGGGCGGHRVGDQGDGAGRAGGRGGVAGAGDVGAAAAAHVGGRVAAPRRVRGHGLRVGHAVQGGHGVHRQDPRHGVAGREPRWPGRRRGRRRAAAGRHGRFRLLLRRAPPQQQERLTDLTSPVWVCTFAVSWLAPVKL